MVEAVPLQSMAGATLGVFPGVARTGRIFAGFSRRERDRENERSGVATGARKVTFHPLDGGRGKPRLGFSLVARCS